MSETREPKSKTRKKKESWEEDPENIELLPTEKEIQRRGHAKKARLMEYQPPKSRKKRYTKLRLARQSGSRVENPGGRLPPTLAGSRNPVVKARTAAELRTLDDNTEVEWPDDVKVMLQNQIPKSIQFKVDPVEGVCRCSDWCSSGNCRNALEGIVCVKETCSRASTDCGRRPNNHRGLALRVFNHQIQLFTKRRIQAGRVVCPYYGKFQIRDPVKRYTVELKMKDQRGKKVFLDADQVGSLGRFINHSCESNSRIEELAGVDGPEIAIIASRTIEQGEEITADYGPHKNFLCECGALRCRDKNRRDPDAEDIVTSRTRGKMPAQGYYFGEDESDEEDQEYEFGG